MTSSATALTALEVASGLVLRHEASPPLPTPPAGETPRGALERAILPALQRPPCLVSFSGGRDSSAVLAVATHLARREGLELPVPATNRFAAAAGTHEGEWQEEVVRALGLEDWARIELGDELDCVGPVATSVIRRHGILWPSNIHFHVPLLERASGGSLLTGVGGDEAFGGSRHDRAVAVLLGRARPRPRDVLRIGLAFSPRALRRLALGRHELPVGAWLRPRARSAVRRAIVDGEAREPMRWRRRFRLIAGASYLKVATANLGLLGADADARISHPLWDPGFLAALAGLPREQRFVDRTTAMRRLFSDVLPERILERPTKARFDEVLWSDASRSLAARWNGEGVDSTLVDPPVLYGVWASPEPDARSYTLLQSVWLHGELGACPGNGHVG